MKILITGAGGYLGSSLMAELANQEFVEHIYAFDNFIYNQGSYLYPLIRSNDKISFRIEDITWFRDGLIEDIKNSDVIIPLAAIVGAPACEKNTNNARRINTTWFENIIPFLKKQLVIYPNTNSGYGSTGKEVCTEKTPSNPLSLYGKLKQETEDLLIKNHKKTICFRLATVFGWSYRPRLDLLINNLAYNSMFDANLELFDGHFRRNYMHIKDIVSAFIFAIKNYQKMIGNVYNLGNDNINTTKKELMDTICDFFARTYMENFDRTDPDKRDYIVSSDKLYKVGYKPMYSIIDGLEELYSFFQTLPIDPDIRHLCTKPMFNY